MGGGFRQKEIGGGATICTTGAVRRERAGLMLGRRMKAAEKAELVGVMPQSLTVKEGAAGRVSSQRESGKYAVKQAQWRRREGESCRVKSRVR